jgi:hypothetical protein
VDWTFLPYRWISVQSVENPAKWMNVLTQPIATAAATRAVPPAVTTN